MVSYRNFFSWIPSEGLYLRATLFFNRAERIFAVLSERCKVFLSQVDFRLAPGSAGEAVSDLPGLRRGPPTGDCRFDRENLSFHDARGGSMPAPKIAALGRR